MEIENIVYRKMSDKEKATVEKIIKKASERPHVQIYDHKYIVKYLLENFKEFTYEEQEDCTDMLDVIFDIAKKFDVMDGKEIEDERKHITNEYINEMFEKSSDEKTGFDV